MIQLNALEDRVVPDKRAWDETCNFMKTLTKARLTATKDIVDGMKGPTWSQRFVIHLYFTSMMIIRWLKWHSPTEENLTRTAIQSECQKLVETEPVIHTSHIIFNNHCRVMVLH